MIFKIQSPFKRLDKTDKSVSLPTPVKLTDGTTFYTWFPELVGGASAGSYDTTQVLGQQNAYTYCAPLNSIVNKQADALKNGRFIFVDGKGNEVKPENKNLANFLVRANPLQTFKQFVAQAYAYTRIHGIAYCLPVFGAFRNEPVSFYVLPNCFVQPQYTRKLYQQTNISEIISGYKVEGIGRIIPPEEMLVFTDSTSPASNQLEKILIPQSRLVSINNSINSVIASTDAWLTMSRPARARGLKRCKGKFCLFSSRRAPRGRVD